MWTYSQTTGLLTNGTLSFQCYSGHGVGKNNHVMQDVHDVGPIPVGFYAIGAPYDSARTGPFTLLLTPESSNDMFGRADFRIHGDSVSAPGSASHGCIIHSPRTDRQAIWGSGDRTLRVTE